MSLRQAIKRSLENEGVDAPAEPAVARGPVKKPRVTAPKPKPAPPKVAVAAAPAAPAPAPRPAAAPRPPPTPRHVVPKPSRTAPGVPQMELEEEREEDDFDEAEDDESDADADEAGAAATAAAPIAEPSMPLKKRFAAHRQESVQSTGSGRPGGGGRATAAPAAADDDDDIPEFDDGFGPDLMGDAEDRARLMGLSDVQRESELAVRAERRLLGQQNVQLRRQLQGAAAGKAAAAQGRKGAAAAKAGAKGKAGAAAARKATAAAAASDDEDEDDEEEDEEEGAAKTKRGGAKGARSGKGGAAGGRGKAGGRAGDASGSASSGSSSSGDGSSSSSDEEEGGRVVGGRRLRRKAHRGGRDGSDGGSGSSSSSSDNGEISAAVRVRGGGAVARGKAADAAAKARQRHHDLFGDSSSGSEGGDGRRGGGDVSMSALKGRVAGGGEDWAVSDDSSEFEDSDDGGAGAATAPVAYAGGAPAARPPGAPGGPGGGVGDVGALPPEERGKDATLADINRLLLRRSRAIEALGTPFGGDIVKGAFIRFHHGPKTFRIARVVDMGIGHDHYDPWIADGGPPKRVDASTVLKTRKVLHYAFGSSDVFADPAKGRGAPALPRLIRVNELSNSSITAEELEAYRRRVFDQARSSRSPLDRLPTRGEVEAQLRRAEALRTSAGFTGAAIARRLEDADAFLESRLGQLHNLSLVHDQTLARIAAAQRTLGDAAPGSAEHRRAGATLARLEVRLERIAAEEARRKAAHHARERQRLSTGRDVSTLTNIINAKVEERNSRVMDELAAAARARTTAQQQALEEDNPFMRRRTAPTVLFRPVDLTAAAAAPAAAPEATAAPAPAPQTGGLGSGVGSLVGVVSEMLDSVGLPDAPAAAPPLPPSIPSAADLALPVVAADASLLAGVQAASADGPAAGAAPGGASLGPRKGISLTEFRNRRKAAADGGEVAS